VPKIIRISGYENPSLEIIVTERCSIGGCPPEEACEHCFLNQSAISIVVLISFLCYCGGYAGYFTVILPFLAFYFCFAYFIYLVSCKCDQGIKFCSKNQSARNRFKPDESVGLVVSNPMQLASSQTDLGSKRYSDLFIKSNRKKI
jgi:hypothetical protein